MNIAKEDPGIIITDSKCSWNLEDEKFKILFESVNDGIIYTNQHGIIGDINSKALELFECEREDFVGKNYEELFEMFKPPEEESETIFIYDETNRPPMLIQWKIKNKTGKIKILGVHHKQIIKVNNRIGSIILLRELMVNNINKGTKHEEVADFYLEMLNQDIYKSIQEIISVNEFQLSKLDSFEEHICVCNSNEYFGNPKNDILSTNDLLLVEREYIEECRNYVQRSLNQAIAINYLISYLSEIFRLGKNDMKSKKMDAYEAIDFSMKRIRSIYYTRKIHKDQPAARQKAIIKGNELLSVAFDSILCNLIDNNMHDEVSIYVSVTPSKSGKFWKFEFRDKGEYIGDNVKRKNQTIQETSNRYNRGSSLHLAVASEIVKQSGGKVMLTAQENGDLCSGRNFVLLLPRG